MFACREPFCIATDSSRLQAGMPRGPLRHFTWATIAQLFVLSLCGAQSVAPAPKIPTPRATQERTLVPPPQASSQQEFWVQFAQKDWTAAIASAEQIVAAARQATPLDTFRLSSALTLLGSAQLNGKLPAAAEASFAEALKLIDQHGNGGDLRLLDPLRGLGYSLAAQSKHEQAIAWLDRGLLVSRRNAGLFDIGQQGMLRQAAASYAALGRPAEGIKYMTYLLRVGEHTYGINDPRIAPLLVVVGNWYAEIGQMAPAREAYRTALDSVVRKLGPQDLAAVEPLRAMASSYVHEVNLSSYGIRTQDDYGAQGAQPAERRLPANADGTSTEGQAMNPRYVSNEGGRALLAALKALDAHQNRSPQVLVDTLLQTGDWFLFKQQFDKALPYYKRAWNVFAAMPGEAKRPDEGPLGFPVQVYYPTPVLAMRNLTRPPQEVEDRFVQVEFTVKADGSIKDARAVDHNGTPRQVSQAVNAIGESRYRPKFVDGEPVETTAMSYRQMFKQPIGKDAE